MPDRDVVLAKAAAIQRCLRRIEEVTGLKPTSLADQNTQDIFVLNLQRAIQSAIDLATHIIAANGLGLPDTIRGNFEFLEQANIIGRDLSRKMQSMVGFRNIAIHQYQTLELDILKAILEKRLKDLEEFYTTILTHFGFTAE
jgi:uncharacterized protein YutE (UPF0331/DUF86 family)